MNNQKKVKGVCIKAYEEIDYEYHIDYDDDGNEIEVEEEVVTEYEVGDEEEIVVGFYDKKFWKESA